MKRCDYHKTEHTPPFKAPEISGGYDSVLPIALLIGIILLQFEKFRSKKE